MNDSFSELREILKIGDIPEDISHVLEPCHRRLLDALRNSPGSGDIVSLVRHVLRHEDAKQGGSSATTLLVPCKPPFPNRSIWDSASITVLREDKEHYLISARPWQPEWLNLADQYPPDAPLFNEKPRRNYEPVSGDPFLQLMKLDKYSNIGQREAIRAVLTAPDSSTLIINLPTGAGKSLCAQLPALLNSRNNNGVSVVVVPTTALAIDQERALKSKSSVHHATAYYSDDTVEGKERREGIRDRIRAGTQRIIFTSPESLMDSLAPALYEAAKRGILRYFIIDEAHMVEQWGDDFRPAFQEIPGLRRDLLRLNSFTTLLLTATLTESCLDTLETLFGQDLQVISAVQLRPEPAYWFKRCETEELRKQRLLEAVYHLPRPLIIYGTKVKDVEDWKRELTRAGFKRCDLMTGKSTTQQREQLIEKWREGKIDIVVATSAFGLGIDQSDVRAVIHVCIPETIDRFYQEVGRGGRDGKACMALTLYTTEDFSIARGLNEKSTITIERGLQRWQSMFAKKEPLKDGKYSVPINNPPSLLERDIDMRSDQNRAWNIRTLTLMNRANLIEIDSEEPPQNKNSESESEQAWEDYRNSRSIRIRNECHLEKFIWESQVEPVRHQRQSWSHKNLELMKETLKAKRCISEIFAQAYSIPSRHTPETRNSVIVSRACGGCPVCRNNGVTPFPGIMPTSRPVWQKPNFIPGKEIQRLLAGEKILLIFYDSLEQLNKFSRGRKLFKWLIEQGMKNIVISPEYNQLLKESSRIHNSFIFLFDSYEPVLMPRIPTLIFHPPGTPLPAKYLSNYNTSTTTRIILLPINTPDPEREDRLLINIFSGRYFKFDIFCTEVSI